MPVPTWGYKPNGAAKIFDIEDGASLPAGWLDSPACIEDETKATAEALTEALRDPVEDEPQEETKRRGRPPKAQEGSI